MLGGVPISVIIPPRMDAKDSGISVRAGLRFSLSAACRSTGISSASAATLFISAESAAETPDIKPIWTNSGRPALMTLPATNSTTPELERPRLIISTNAMTTVAG